MSSIQGIEEVVLSRDIRHDLAMASAGYADNKIFMVFDNNTWQHCRHHILGFRQIREDHIMVIEAGEENKSIEQVMKIWTRFGELGIDRSSLIINVGGGMITDLGGFAASTLKRGLAFINIPTSLLAMIDASVGGKSGINFRGLKNEVGVIRLPDKVFIYIPFLKTLSHDEFLSGFAEMLKAALIGDAVLWHEIRRADTCCPDDPQWEKWIWKAIEIKKNIVASDLFETGARKALNFGHTIGHAWESESMVQGAHVLHGYAIAHGMVIESQISRDLISLDEAFLNDISQTMKHYYGPLPDMSHLSDELISWMRFDKKNSGNQIHFTLLKQIGQFEVNHTLDEGSIKKYLKTTGF